MPPETITDLLSAEPNPSQKTPTCPAWRVSYRTSAGRELVVHDVMQLNRPTLAHLQESASRFPSLWFPTR